ncbi:Ig domain-containing protein [Diaphorobacter sp. HDW4B]|uniref:Ig domain-containing protein n=1 Tax=Diaphorobacter sp. HDW4B TaxID=2714925 RepID=UPI00197A8E32|nr:Ig domain-containing protein [Diaphorobacter sp. HDW4B]
MKTIFRLSSLLVAATLVACGGGGGSGGESAQQYSITLRADKTQLPLNANPGQNGPATGAYAQYTTTLYVSAESGGKPIPGGEDIFACNTAAGLDSGALYYLDGNPSHETDGVPNAYRSVTLGSNSGGNSFHFHAGTQAGTARVTCTVTDPRDKKQYAASVDITVGAATGKAAWVTQRAQAGVTLGTQLNASNLPSSVAVQANIFDDANQAIANPTAANLQLSIRPTTAAATGAKLSWGTQVGSVLQISSIGGVGTFALRSGANAGPILLEAVTDRADNNVANGIQDPISSLLIVTANAEVASSNPLTISTTPIDDATLATPYSFVLSATGGNAPYTWSSSGALPPGLSLSSTGLISGVPSANVTGTYKFVLTVTDAIGKTATQNVTMTVGGTPTYTPLNITLSGCSSDLSTACALPDATSGAQYVYAFSATGGDPTKAITWTVQPAGWLTMNASGNSGVLSGTPTSPTAVGNGIACNQYTYVVTATQGTTLTSTRKVTVNVTNCPAIVTPPTTGTGTTTTGP